MEALRIREDGNGSHLDVAQVAVSLGSLTVEMALFDAARAFFDLALRNYTFDESADAHPRAAHALAGLARVRRHQGSKMLQQRDSLSARRAGLLVLDEAINFQAQAVRSRASLGQRHGLYQASVAELRAMESQRDQIHRAMKSADADAPPSPPSSMAASSPERGSPLREISPSGQVRVIAPTAPTLAECRGSPANTPRNGNPAPPHD